VVVVDVKRDIASFGLKLKVLAASSRFSLYTATYHVIVYQTKAVRIPNENVVSVCLSFPSRPFSTALVETSQKLRHDIFSPVLFIISLVEDFADANSVNISVGHDF
jgi:hypothetical protein